MENQFTTKIESVSSKDFINSAVEHLVSAATFSHVNVGFQNVRLQTLYFIVENLLKGYYISLKGDDQEAALFAIRRGHNLDILIEKCRELDSDFLEWLEVLPANRRTIPESSLTESEKKEKYLRSDFAQC